MHRVGISCDSANTMQNYYSSRVTWRTLGITRMKSLAHGIVWWPKLDEEIETMVHSCSIFQTHWDNPPVAPLIPWKWPSRPWCKLHIDYAGPFLGHM